MTKVEYEIVTLMPPGDYSKCGRQLVDVLPVTTITIPPYTTTNAVFFGWKAFWLIDPGSPFEDQQKILRDYIDHRIARGVRLLGILITHHHGDHLMAAEFISRLFSVPIYAHPNAKPFLQFPFQPLKNDQLLCHEGELPLLAMHTPGHAEDHMVFYSQDAGILIAGDMITDHGTTLIPPQGGSLKAYLLNLDKLSRLMPLNALIPAHGKAILERPDVFLIKAMKHRYERIRSVFVAIKDQAEKSLDATQITEIIYRSTVTEDLMRFAQFSVESSLLWLKEECLLENPHYLWQLTSDADARMQHVLLNRLAQIDERLRNA